MVKSLGASVLANRILMVGKSITFWFPRVGGRTRTGRLKAFQRAGIPGGSLSLRKGGRGRGEDSSIIFSGNSVRRDLKNHDVVAW